MSYQYPPDPFKEAHEVINSLVAYYSDRNSDQLKEIQHLVDDITNGAAQKEALVQQNIRGASDQHATVLLQQQQQQAQRQLLHKQQQEDEPRKV
eukprot:jgi/Chrzof1/10946/Cz05g18080.t1